MDRAHSSGRSAQERQPVAIGKDARDGFDFIAIRRAEVVRRGFQHVVVEEHPDVLAVGPSRRRQLRRCSQGSEGDEGSCRDEESGSLHDRKVAPGPDGAKDRVTWLRRRD